MDLNPPRSPLRPPPSAPIVLPTKKRFIADDPIPLLPPPASQASTQATQTSKQPGAPRLVIEKLVLTNFKSYVGVQEVGPFHRSFLAVVGPNGSGKSNVIDLMLFVFGFRAAKMRQTKLLELIHTLDKHKNLPFCSVDIHFAQVVDLPDGDTQLVSGLQMVVTRKAYRNNSSDYFVDGVRSLYTKVTSMLKEQGIDLDHKRFLILQGEVELIAQMKPKAEKEGDDGLLEYLEDIIGTAHYKGQIEDGLKRVEELNDVCKEKQYRFVIVEKEIEGLENDKDKALEFLRLERELVFARNKVLQAQIIRRKEKEKRSIEARDVAKLKLDSERQAAQEASASLKNIETKRMEKSLEIKKVSANISEFQKKKRSADRERVRYEEQRKNLETRSKKCEKAAEVAEKQLQKTGFELQNHEKDHAEAQEQQALLKAELEQDTQKLVHMRSVVAGKTRPYTEKAAELQKALAPWREKIGAAELALKVSQLRVEMLRAEALDVDGDISKRKSKLENVRSQKKELEERKESLVKEKKKVTQQLDHGIKETHNAQTKLAEMHESLSRAQTRVSEAKSNLLNVQNKSKVLSGLQRLQRTGRIQGFHGRLGDLGHIDEQYDVAVLTACPQLDDMVVDSVETGQQCINFLRLQKLGYARFICLDKLRVGSMAKPNTPENCPRLFDLISVKDERFLPAFYSVLRDTLVAPDLRTANRAAYGKRRFRVVTLDGKLIDTSGTLSGGGSHVSKGGMKTGGDFGVSAEEVGAMEAELASQEEHFGAARNAFQEMEAAVARLRERAPEIDTELDKTKMEAEALKSEEEGLIKEIGALEKGKQARIEKVEADVLEAEQEVSARQKTLEELQLGASELQGQLKETEEKILEVGGVDLRVQNLKIDGLKQKLEIWTKRATAAMKGVKKALNEIRRAQRALSDAEKEKATVDGELAALELNWNSKGSSEALGGEIERLEGVLEELKAEEAELREKEGGLKGGIEERRMREVELEGELERREGDVKHQKGVLRRLEGELKGLKLNDVGGLIGWLGEGEEEAKQDQGDGGQQRKAGKKRRRKDEEGYEESGAEGASDEESKVSVEMDIDKEDDNKLGGEEGENGEEEEEEDDDDEEEEEDSDDDDDEDEEDEEEEHEEDEEKEVDVDVDEKEEADEESEEDENDEDVDNEEGAEDEEKEDEKIENDEDEEAEEDDELGLNDLDKENKTMKTKKSKKKKSAKKLKKSKKVKKQSTMAKKAKKTKTKSSKSQRKSGLNNLASLKAFLLVNTLPQIPESELSNLPIEDILAEIESLTDKLNGITIDVDILAEYGRRATEYKNRKEDLNNAVEERETLSERVEQMKKDRLSQFMKGFYTILMTLKEMYQMITMGGNAELELVDSLDPFAEGILFSVMPPKKLWKNISNLSGGEKTLSLLALVFALHKYKPTPLYVMDEIDAALDFRNVSIVANYIKERTKNAQFIVISLRNNMFELSERLVGIYKVDNMTRSVTLNNRELIGE